MNEEQKKLIDLGVSFMKSALQKIEEGDVEEFLRYKEIADKNFKMFIDTYPIKDWLYNESRNFGIIYHVFEANVNNLLKTEEGKNKLRKIAKEIKGNKVLHEQLKLFNNLQPENRVKNSKDYVNECIKLMPRFSKEQIKEVNDKLINLIRSENLNELIEINEDKLSLYNAIEYVTLNEKTLSNLDEFIEATNIIEEAINNLPEKDENTYTLNDYENEVKGIIEKYSEVLTDDDIKLLHSLNGENNEKVFNEVKNNLLSMLDNIIEKETDVENKGRLFKIIENVKNKSYTKDSVVLDTFKLLDMKNTLE